MYNTKKCLKNDVAWSVISFSMNMKMLSLGVFVALQLWHDTPASSSTRFQ